jgi:hypothetical protein
VDRVLAWSQNQGISLAYQGAAPDLGAYEFEPLLELSGAPDDQAISLSWTVNVTLAVTSTWTISYVGTPGSEPSPITGLSEPTRAYTLSGLTNYELYTVTLNAMLEGSPILTDTVSVMPTDIVLYLPTVVQGFSTASPAGVVLR